MKTILRFGIIGILMLWIYSIFHQDKPIFILLSSVLGLPIGIWWFISDFKEYQVCRGVGGTHELRTLCGMVRDGVFILVSAFGIIFFFMDVLYWR